MHINYKIKIDQKEKIKKNESKIDVDKYSYTWLQNSIKPSVNGEVTTLCTWLGKLIFQLIIFRKLKNPKNK